MLRLQFRRKDASVIERVTVFNLPPHLVVSVLQGAAHHLTSVARHLEATFDRQAFEANLRIIDQAANDAAGQGADLLVMPELFVTDYDLRTVAAGFGFSEFDYALQVLEQISTRHHIGLLASLPVPARARQVVNGQEVNAWCIGAVFFSPDGTVGTDGTDGTDGTGGTKNSRNPDSVSRLDAPIIYRKVQLFGSEKQHFMAGDESPPIFQFRGFSLSCMVCFDVEFPEMVRHVAQAGADILLVPTALMDPYDEPARILVPARAFENHIAIAYANHLSRPTQDLLLTGGSVIVGPDGIDLARAASYNPATGSPTSAATGKVQSRYEILTATISRADLVASRTAFNYLHERRTQTYNTWVDEHKTAGDPSESKKEPQ